MVFVTMTGYICNLLKNIVLLNDVQLRATGDKTASEHPKDLNCGHVRKLMTIYLKGLTQNSIGKS